MSAPQFEYSDIGTGCTAAQYVAQWPSVTPVLGEVYCYAPDDWMGCKVTIVFVDDRIAVGLLEPKFGAKLGNYMMYHSTGPYAGYKYQDTVRPFYRLQPLK